MILIVHYDYRAYHASLLSPEGVEHCLWGQSLTGRRYDHIVILGRGPAVSSDLELQMQLDWHDCDLATTLKPGGTIIYGQDADPRKEASFRASLVR